jgi:AhpD family alkylhydroperoxidase
MHSLMYLTKATLANDCVCTYMQKTSLSFAQRKSPGLPVITRSLRAINGCGMRMDSHENVLRKHDVDAFANQSTSRIAAVLQAAAVTLTQVNI